METVFQCHCEGVKRPKPCPEQSEGTHEIATGNALATTSGRIATLPRIECGVARNDRMGVSTQPFAGTVRGVKRRQP